MLIHWFIGAGIGILFGLIPAWSWFVAEVSISVINKRKSLPKWMIWMALGNPSTKDYNWGIISDHHLYIVPRIIAITLIIIILVGYHYFAFATYLADHVDGLEVIVLETSLPLFFLLTWLVPSYFLRRYLSHLGVHNGI